MIALELISLLGCGLIAGVFFAFSTFVMAALARRPAAEAIATMQTINITVINPWFMTVFIGTALTCFVTIVLSLMKSFSPYPILGGSLYLLGTFLVTIVGNVPLNDALAVVTPDSAEGAVFWSKYLADWTMWNHVRTVAAFFATVFFALSLGK
jgi:uncharacterized membrane protein